MIRILTSLIAVAALNAGHALAADTVLPFDGKSLSGWKLKGDTAKSKWKVGVATLDEKAPTKLAIKEGTGELINGEVGGIDISTEAKFGDCTIEIDVMVPKGSNSGIYLMGEYELQILDSFGKTKLGQGDMGAIYSAAAPKLNASKKPGEWQKFVIDFQAPKFEGDKKVANAKFIKVTLNDQVIQENVEVQKSTGGALTGKEAPTGPLMFQGDHGPVAFRNIKITPKR